MNVVKQSKKQVDYRSSLAGAKKRCGTCIYKVFEQKGCTKVDGDIDKDCVCNLWKYYAYAGVVTKEHLI